MTSCTETALQYGQNLASSRSVSPSSYNVFSCTTCHETVPLPTHLRPGYTLYGAADRPSWWGGFELTLLDSFNQCITDFMRGEELAATDEKARGLYVYLQSLEPAGDPPTPLPISLPLTVVLNIVDVPSGDPIHGEALFKDGCGNCHGAVHTGAGRLSTACSIVPDDTITAHGTDPTLGARPVVIEKVRHGKFFGVGGDMPLYSTETLADDDLGDILAYLEMYGLPPSSPSPSPSPSASPGP